MFVVPSEGRSLIVYLTRTYVPNVLYYKYKKRAEEHIYHVENFVRRARGCHDL